MYGKSRTSPCPKKRPLLHRFPIHSVSPIEMRSVAPSDTESPAVTPSREQSSFKWATLRTKAILRFCYTSPVIHFMQSSQGVSS